MPGNVTRRKLGSYPESPGDVREMATNHWVTQNRAITALAITAQKKVTAQILAVGSESISTALSSSAATENNLSQSALIPNRKS